MVTSPDGMANSGSGRSLRQQLSLGATLILVGACPLGGARAQSISTLERQIQALQNNYQRQIQNLQEQVRQLKERQNFQEERSEVIRRQAVRMVAAQDKIVSAQEHKPHVIESKTHEFGLESADGENSIALTGRLHLDAGGYTGYNPGALNKPPKQLSSGENFRRARIGVVGQFMDDWAFGLIYDFGGSSDSLVTAQPGAGTSGIENAFITYNGFYKHHQQIPIAIDIGAIDVPWTLEEGQSSNDIMFLERASPQVIAATFGAGDFRTVFGIHSNNDRYYFNAYLTGPTTGALHTYTTATCPTGTTGTDCTGPQMSFLARGSYQLIQNDFATLHLGVNYADQFRPRGSTNLETITLSDRPELRIDPTSFLSTGAMPAHSGSVIGGEGAASLENAYVQAEYFHYSIDRIDLPHVAFNGGYVEASYSLGGKRHYKPATGAYTDVIPDHPLSFENGGLGALEIAARYSRVNLNDDTTPSPVYGGDQKTYAIGLNYHPNVNMRFMLDFEHVDIEVPGGTTAKAARLNTVALRSQVNF